MCGEYGSELERPHYHAIIFNHDFDDKKPIKYSNNSILYTSEQLQQLWPYGYVSIGDANYTTAAYVARYSVKKIFGEDAESHYQGKHPEYISMSLRPGIGYDYIVKYEDELRQHDSVTLNGREYPLPSYYDLVFEDLDRQKAKRRSKVDKENSTIARLRVRETVAEGKRKLWQTPR